MDMTNKKCPQCDSENIRQVDYLVIKAVICSKCGFDETKEYNVFPEENKSQKAKAEYNPYKQGGKARTRK